MIVLDAAAVIAFVRDEPAANEVERILRSGQAAMSAVNLAEAVDVLLRRHGVAQAALDELPQLVVVRPAGLAQARLAGHLRARHYDRSRRVLSLADCFLLASAGLDDQIATADQAVVDTAAAEGLSVVSLQNSRGLRARRPR